MRTDCTNCVHVANAKRNELEAPFERLFRHTYTLPSGRVVKIIATDESELVDIQLRSGA